MFGWLSMSIGTVFDAIISNWYLIIYTIGVIVSSWIAYKALNKNKKEFSYKIIAWENSRFYHPALDTDAKDLAMVLSELNQQGVKENLDHLGLLIPQASWCRVEKPFLYVDFMIYCTKTEKPVLKVEIPCMMCKVSNDRVEVYIPKVQEMEDTFVFHQQDLKRIRKFIRKREKGKRYKKIHKIDFKNSQLIKIDTSNDVSLRKQFD